MSDAGLGRDVRLSLEVRSVTRLFGRIVALDGVTLSIASGRIHALLGPNGAGKTTLLRIVSGLTAPTSGTVQFHGADGAHPGGWESRRLVGLVTSNERNFYHRLSGVENLTFFGRLYGFRRRESVARAHDLLEMVGLSDAAQRRVGVYSHGMKKRLGIARALLADPPVLLVDEATHDLDPEGARTVRDLVAQSARSGTAVLWATQRLDEVRGFAHAVTLLHQGTVRFAGTVAQLMSHSSSGRYVVRLAAPEAGDAPLSATFEPLLAGLASISDLDADPDHYLLSVADGASLGAIFARLASAQVDVLSCREERSEIEEAFLQLVGGRES